MARTALYRHFDADGRLLYVGITDDLAFRDKTHRATADWHGDVVRTETQWCLSRSHASALERVAIQFEGPLHNIALSRVETPVDALEIVRQTPAEGAARITAYLNASGVKRTVFAEKLGISKSHMTELCQGKKKPGRELAFRIEAATVGVVAASTWSEAA